MKAKHLKNLMDTAGARYNYNNSKSESCKKDSAEYALYKERAYIAMCEHNQYKAEYHLELNKRKQEEVLKEIKAISKKLEYIKDDNFDLSEKIRLVEKKYRDRVINSISVYEEVTDLLDNMIKSPVDNKKKNVFIKLVIKEIRSYIIELTKKEIEQGYFYKDI